MLLLCLIAMAEAKIWDIVYGDFRGPLVLGPTLSWQVSQIQLDSNHKDSFSKLYLFFNLRYANIDLKNIYAEIQVPGDQTTNKCQILPIVQEINDWVAACNYTVEKAGTYGPVSLTLKFGETGQIMAESRTFGYFSVLDNKPIAQDKSLSVSYILPEGKTDLFILEPIILNFSFILGKSQRLNPGDFLCLKKDPNFIVDEDNFKIIVSDNRGPFEGIDVEYDKQNEKLYIYGFFEGIEGIDKGNKIWIRIEGLVNPWYEKSGNDYIWTIDVLRYGTPTILYSFKGAGPEQGIIAGDVTVDSWKPKHEKIKDYMAAGLLTFTEIVFRSNKIIPNDGSIVITVSKALFCSKIHTTSDKQVPNSGPGSGSSSVCSITARDDNSNEIECTVADSGEGSVATCSPKVTIQQNLKIYFTALTQTTSASLSIISILTRDRKGKTMTSLKTVFTTSATTATLLTVNQLYISKSFNNIDAKNMLGIEGTHGIVIAFNAPTDLAVGDSIKVYLPVSTASTRNSDFISLTSDYFGLYKIGDSLSFSAGTSLDSSFSITNNKVQVTTNSISITLEAPASNGKGLIIYIGAGSKAYPINIYLPLKPTQFKHFSESIVILTKSKTNYIYAKPLFFTSNSQDLTLDIAPFCSNVFAPGLPIRVKFTPTYDYSLGDLRAYISFSKNFTSLTNLVTGGRYPSIDSEVYLDSKGDFMLKLSSLKKGTTTTFTVAYPALAASTAVTATLNVKLLDGSNEITVFTSSDSFTPDATDITAGVSKSISLQSELSYTLTLPSGNHDNDPTTSQSDVRYLFVLPRGFSFSNSKLSTLGPGFQYYTYMTGFSTKKISETSSNDFTETIIGPWFEISNQNMYVAVASGIEFNTNPCIKGVKVALAIGSALSMTVKDFKPQSQKAYSWGAGYAELVLILSVSKKIMPSSYITFEIGDNWSGSYVPELTYLVFGSEYLTGEYISNGSWKSKITTKIITGDIVLHAWVRLPKISSSSPSISYIGFKSVNVYYNGLASPALSFKWSQSTDDPNLRVLTKFSTGNTTPLKSFAENWAFPDVAGSQKVFFGTNFEAPYDLNAGTIIEIYSEFLADTLAQKNSWCNIGHKFSEVSGGVLKLTLLQDIKKGNQIKITKDFAFDLSSAGFKKVLIKAKADGEYMIDDSADTTDDGSQGFIVKEKPKIVIDGGLIKTSKYNAGIDSWYIFSLSFNDTLGVSDFIQFNVNKDFNAQAGNTFKFEYLPGFYYIESYSVDEAGNFDFILCKTDHWVISCSITEASKLGNKLTILLHLINPPSKSYCSIYMTNWEGELTVAPYYISETEAFQMINNFSGSLDLLYTIPHNSEIDRGMKHSLILVSRANLLLSSQSAFLILFPYPYNLGLTDPKGTRCEIIYDDGSSQKGQIISEESVCEIDGNLVIFNVNADLEKDFKLSSDFATIFSVKGLVTPKEGYQGKMFFYDFPYPRSEKFSSPFTAAYISITPDSDKFDVERVDSISMNNLNAAFTSFEITEYEELLINNGARLITSAGCFTGKYRIEPKNKELFAREIEIRGKPRGNAPIVLDMSGVYTLRPDFPLAEFKVGAPSNADPGFYYIDWFIKEDALGLEEFYAPPPPSIVEINTNITYPLTIPLDIIVPPGYQSFPYPIQIDGGDYVVAPFDTLEVRLSHNHEFADIKFSPEVLFFDENNNFATVSIYCGNCTINNAYEFIAILEGPSAKSFKVDHSIKFTFTKPYENPAVIKVDVVNQTSNNIDISLYSDSLAIVTWALSGEYDFEEYKMTEEYIINNARGFGSTRSNQTSFDDKFNEYSNELFRIMNNSNTYDKFALHAMNLGRKIYLIKQDFILEDEVKTVASFNQLVPESKFYFYMYVNNFCGNQSVLTTMILETQSLPPHAQIQVKEVNDEDNLTQAMVSLFKIDSNRFEKKPRREGPKPNVQGRNLAESDSFTVYSSMTSPTSAYSKVSQYTTDELSAKLGVTVTSISKIDVDTYPNGDWETQPEWFNQGEIVNLNFTSKVDGNLICEIETNPNTAPANITTSQVLLGLDRTGAENNDTGYSIEVTAVTEGYFTFNFSGYYENDYVISCIVCNEYPLTPECSNVTSLEYSNIMRSSFDIFMISGLGILIL